MSPAPDVPFDALLAAAKSGDERGLTAIYAEFQPRVLRYLRSVEPRAADDLSSDVWLAVARGLSTFVGDVDDFRAWVFSIARRRLADLRRTSARRATDPVPVDTFGALASTASTADIVVGRMSAQEAAELVVRTLPPDQAEVVLLRVLGELDAGQIADLMGRSANWVRVTQHRALRHLAAAMAGAAGASAEILGEPVMNDAPRTICPS